MRAHLVLVVLLAGCRGEAVEPSDDVGVDAPGETTPTDSALEDSALEDSALEDSALTDTADSALSDSGVTDTALTDTALTDTALTDTALADTALADTALADTSADTTSDTPAADTSTCVDVAGNIAPNGSFELGSATSVSSWPGGFITPVSMGADHCDRYGKYVDPNASGYGKVSLTISGPFAAGDEFTFGLSARGLDGVAAPVEALLASESGGDLASVYTAATPVTGEWVRVDGYLKLTAPTAVLKVAFGNAYASSRTIGIDRVWVVRKTL